MTILSSLPVLWFCAFVLSNQPHCLFVKDIQAAFGPTERGYLETQLHRYMRAVGAELSERMVFSLGWSHNTKNSLELKPQIMHLYSSMQLKFIYRPCAFLVIKLGTIGFISGVVISWRLFFLGSFMKNIFKFKVSYVDWIVCNVSVFGLQCMLFVGWLKWTGFSYYYLGLCNLYMIVEGTLLSGGTVIDSFDKEKYYCSVSNQLRWQ